MYVSIHVCIHIYHMYALTHMPWRVFCRKHITYLQVLMCACVYICTCLSVHLIHVFQAMRACMCGYVCCPSSVCVCVFDCFSIYLCLCLCLCVSVYVSVFVVFHPYLRSNECLYIGPTVDRTKDIDTDTTHTGTHARTHKHTSVFYFVVCLCLWFCVLC